MKSLKRKLSGFLVKFWPIGVIAFVVLIFFHPVWLQHLHPIPGDFIVGTYFPWLDYKWGNIVGVAVKNPIISDAVSINYPLKSMAIDLIKSGRIPLWNNDMFAGFPLLANTQLALFSPTSVLYFLLPKIWAWTGQIVLQPFLAALFTYLLLRHFKLSKVSSMFGGLVYAFSGFNLIWMEWNERTLVAAFMPLILLIVDKIIVEKKLIYALALSILMALQFFSGYPQLIIYTGILCLIWVVFKRGFLNKKVVGLIPLSILLGLFLISIQLLPAFELLVNSQRVSEVISNVLLYLPLQNLITFVAPDFFGNHATGNFWGVGNYTLNVGYSGVITLALAAVATFYLFKKTEVKFFLSILFISLLLALENPISIFIWKSGFLGFGPSSNTRALVLANFSLAGLSAFAIDFAIKTKRKINLFPGIIIVFMIFLVFALTFIARSNASSLVLRNNYLVGMRNLAPPLAFVIFMTILLIIRNFYFNSRRLRFIVATLIIILSIVELFRFGWKYTPFSKAEYIFPETPVITLLKNVEKPNRILPGDVIPMNMWVAYGMESLSGYNAAYPAVIAKYIAVSNGGNKDVLAQGTYGTLELFTSKLTDIANGEYLLIKNIDIQKPYKDLIANGDLVKVFSDRSVTIYKKTGALPRAVFVTDWSVLSGDKIFDKLLDPKFNPAKEVVLEKEPAVSPSNEANISNVKYISYSPNESQIEVSTQQAGILFVSDTFYTGWQAYIDGNSTEILRANYAFRAIEVPKGAHKIVFIYDPKSFRIGEWISFAGLVILIALFAYGYKIRRNG